MDLFPCDYDGFRWKLTSFLLGKRLHDLAVGVAKRGECGGSESEVWEEDDTGMNDVYIAPREA